MMKKFRIIPRFAPAIKLDDFSIFFKKADTLNIINKFEEQFASFLNRKYYSPEQIQKIGKDLAFATSSYLN